MLKIFLPIAPLSTNRLFQGRRFKTKEYAKYQEEILWQLPPLPIPKGKLTVIYEIGMSNKNADLANVEKGLTDILQKKYHLLNDKNIYKLIMERKDVPKGEEYICFQITSYTSQ